MAAYLEIAAHSAYDMFSKYRYLITVLFFSISFFFFFFFWNGNFFLVAPFPDHCLLAPFCSYVTQKCNIHGFNDHCWYTNNFFLLLVSYFVLDFCYIILFAWAQM